MLLQISYALVSAVVFTTTLRVANALPRGADGQTAVPSTLSILFLLSWAGGMWGRLVLGFDSPHPFPFLFAGLLGSLALAPYSMPIQVSELRLQGHSPPRLAAFPSPRLWWLMGYLAVSILMRYALQVR
jgi:hypothetical protein